MAGARWTPTADIASSRHNALIHDYLAAGGHYADESGAPARPIRNNRTGRPDRAITGDGVHKLVRACRTAT